MNSLFAFCHLTAPRSASRDSTISVAEHRGAQPPLTVRVTIAEGDHTPLPEQSAQVSVRAIKPGGKSHHAITNASGEVVFDRLPSGCSILCRVKSPSGKAVQTRVIKWAEGETQAVFSFDRQPAPSTESFLASTGSFQAACC